MATRSSLRLWRLPGLSPLASSNGAANSFRHRLAIRYGIQPPGSISKSAEGEFALDTIGLAWQPGEARAIHSEIFPILKPWLEDAAASKITCDVKSAILMLDRLGVNARGFDHDVMLYAFLLDADPSGCPLEEQARRRMDLKLGSSPEQHADITLEIWNQLSPAVDQRNLRELIITVAASDVAVSADEPALLERLV